MADRLANARKRQFAGRAAELELFRSALQKEAPSFSVLYIYGPGGIGKTALLGEYARLAEEAGRPTVRLDGHEVQPSPHGVTLALSQALGLAEGEDPLAALCELKGLVLLVDTFEAVQSLDGWVRSRLLALLPADSLTVIAGRNATSEGWRSDPGWAELTRVASLRNLLPEESRALLLARGVSSDAHEAILSYTYGHPLALSLAAEVARAGRPVGDLTSAGADVVQPLLERFVAAVPSALHRQALEAAAVARYMTQATLAAGLVLDKNEADTFEIFEWLRRLPVTEQIPQGLMLHDIVREIIYEDLRWRDPDRLRWLSRRISRVESDRFLRSRGPEQHQAFWNLIFVGRHHPSVRPFFDWSALGGSYAERARPEDRDDILALVERHEGPESARIADHWFRRQPEAFHAFHSAGSELAGLVASITVGVADEEDAAIDPAVAAIRRHIERNGPLRAGEKVMASRFWMDSEGNQASTAQNMSSLMEITLWMTEPGLAWYFIVGRETDHWVPMLDFINFHRVEGGDFVVGNRRYVMVAHDWRAEPPVAWWRAIGERRDQFLGGPEATKPPAAPTVVVLSQPEFRDAVRRAYRDCTRADALAANPLARSRLVADSDGPGDASAKLQALLRAAVESLNTHPRDQKLYRALWHTYIQPAPGQEAAAELLDLPFSTYRRHLGVGLDRATDWLWRRELHGTRER